MNRLEKTVNKLSKYPQWVTSFLIGRMVPFVGTAGVKFEKVSTAEVIVSIKNRRKAQNHIKQIHAAAMVLLAETATGIVVGMNVPDDRLPLIKSIESKFVKRSQGAMKARAYLTEAQRSQILAEEKGDLIVPVEITDETGEAPIICEMCWAWVPKKKKA